MCRNLSTEGSGLFARLKNAPNLTPTITLSYLLAVVCATLIHMLTVFCGLMGVLLIINNWPNVFFIALGLLLLCITWLLLPRLSTFPKHIAARQSLPTLYAVADEVASALHTARPYGIVITGKFNAAYGRAGWRRRPILYLGLPLLSILDDQEVVALLAHKLAHGVNGDVTRSFFVGSALNSLSRWHHILRPIRIGANDHYRYGRYGLAALISQFIMLLMAQVVWYIAWVLSHLVWRDMQRAEYLADHLAAQIGGTAATLAVFEKFQQDSLFA